MVVPRRLQRRPFGEYIRFEPCTARRNDPLCDAADPYGGERTCGQPPHDARGHRGDGPTGVWRFAPRPLTDGCSQPTSFSYD